MITYNTYYNNIDELSEFISSHKKIASSKTLLIQIFSGVIDLNILQELASFLSENIPHANIIGSTTDGEILEDKVTTQEIVISFSIFEKSTIKINCLETICNEESFVCGAEIANNLLEKDSKVLILFASGLCVNGEEFLNGIQSVNQEIIVAGGLSADNANFKESYLICNNKIQTTGAVGVSINSTELIVQNKYSLAWDNLGRKFKVNKSLNNRVYEIDGRTPYDLYKHYLGDEVAKNLPGIGIEFPLIIQKDGNKIARAVIKLHDDGSMTFAGNIKQGAEVRFGIGNIEELLNGSYKLSQSLKQYNNESIFIYSCMARRRYLEDKASLDIKDFSNIASVSGFFTYGEFFSTKNSNEFLNESLTLLALSEDSTKVEDVQSVKKQDFSDSLLKQKALSNIINKTSEELDYLNATLEKKVIEKAQENMKHEKYIFEQDKQAQMGDMIANIAHQWRQPLSAISSNASSILVQEKLGITKSEELVSTMEQIIKNTQFLSETINTFRNFIKEDNEKKDVIIQERLDLVLEIISTTLNDCNIKLINNIDYSKPIQKNITTGELSQVILNLINNAKDILLDKKIKNPWVKIECSCINENIVISIEDNAGGIKEDIINKVFDPYFTTKHQSQGTGIGLYMSRNIIEDHLQGKLYVKNSQNGAMFFIKIPL